MTWCKHEETTMDDIETFKAGWNAATKLIELWEQEGNSIRVVNDLHIIRRLPDSEFTSYRQGMAARYEKYLADKKEVGEDVPV